MAELSLQRLLAIGHSLPPALRKEHTEIVHKLAHELHVPAIVLRDVENDGEVESEHASKKAHRDDVGTGPSSAREKFQRQERQAQREQHQPSTLTRKVARQQHGTLRSTSNGSGNSDCDISSQEIKDAYDQVRDDNSATNWIALGYGANKKALELRGSGEGGLQEFNDSLKEDEVTYGYVRVIYGDSQRSKFVFITYVPDTLSTLTKARANTHKPIVNQYLKYMHIDVYANTIAELDESIIQAKLAAAAGANYGTGGNAAAGSEDFGSVKDNAKNFFQQSEKQTTSYQKEAAPVAHKGGIAERYLQACAEVN